MIRFGLIGCGNMAGTFLPRLHELDGRMRTTALVDVDLERAKKASEHAPDARVEADYHRVFNDVDAVLIALPHDLHHPVAMDFLKAGKHVLLEKPLAVTEKQCLELIHTAEEVKKILSVGYIMRYDPLWQRMGQYIREQTFGPVFQVSIWTEQYTDNSRVKWLGEKKRMGGGQFFNHGCHYIDLLLHWLGRPVEGTHLGTNFGTPWMADMEGTSNVAIKFESGALGYHFGTWGARGSRLGYSVHAHATQGMLELNHAEGTITLHRDESGGDLPALQSEEAAGAKVESPKQKVLDRRERKGGKPAAAEISAFLDCIEQKQRPVTDPRLALQSLRVIWRLYDAEQRHVVADLRGLGLDEFKDGAVVGTAGQVEV
jgi:predicted dehydrogenase